MTQIAGRRFLSRCRKQAGYGRIVSPWESSRAPYQSSYFVAGTSLARRVASDRIASRRVSSRLSRWARTSTLLGQGCQGSITIARWHTRMRASYPLLAGFTWSTIFLFFRWSSSFIVGSSPNPLPERGFGHLPLFEKNRRGAPSWDPIPSSWPRFAPLVPDCPLWSPSGRTSAGSRRRFDLWIPSRRQRDDQSSNYGRIPHTCAQLSGLDRSAAPFDSWYHLLLSVLR